MSEDDDEVPPLDPKRVAVFVILLGLIAFAGWRYWRAREAVAATAAVAEASKDYRKLFPARSAEVPAPPPTPIIAAEAPVSGMAMLKIDDDMRAPKPAPKPASATAPPPEIPPGTTPGTPPDAAVKAEAAAPVKPVKKTFNQPRLNSGAFSGLNGGSGVGFSGNAMSGGGAPPAAPAMPVVPADDGKK